MKDTSKNGSNGAATLNAKGSQTFTTAITKPETKAETPTEETRREETPTIQTPPPVATLESQRAKAEKLQVLFEREEKLNSTRRELERFKLATDDGTNQLELKDGKGATFRTSNPVLIKVVMDDIMTSLKAKQEQLTGEIIAIG
ncbi:MAG: hypothetical protein JSS76_08475 [Bacteroidetes bacterium]|nr:hypothetical protein [Bacteroidota bacterium]